MAEAKIVFNFNGTVDEIKLEKAKTEAEIVGLVIKFKALTGLKVTGITTHRLDNLSGYSEASFFTLDVEL
jgi:hypothetical protein